MCNLWTKEEVDMVREMWTSGSDDAAIAAALSTSFRKRTVQSVRSARARYGFVKDSPNVDSFGDYVSNYALTPEMRVLMDEAYVDAMIAAGYLPSDPKVIRDGKGASALRHQPTALVLGSSCLA